MLTVVDPFGEIGLTDEFVLTKRFRSANEFSIYIEEQVKEKKCGYMEAILNYCDEKDLDPQNISSLISQSLKDKVRVEAEELNYIKKRAQLPL
jgi:hypothetical protein